MTTLTLAEVKAQNKANGQFFFSRDTMRFFKSRIHGGLRQGKYFITSENNYNASQRLYTIRLVKENFSIDTVGTFQTYHSLDEAKTAIKMLGVK